jgi:hypothetical protein
MWLAPYKNFDFPGSFFDFCDLVLYSSNANLAVSSALTRRYVLECHSTFEHHAHVVPCAHNAWKLYVSSRESHFESTGSHYHSFFDECRSKLSTKPFKNFWGETLGVSTYQLYYYGRTRRSTTKFSTRHWYRVCIPIRNLARFTAVLE